MSTLLDCWQIHKDSMGGSKDLPIVYVDRRVGEVALKEHTERKDEFTGYTMKQVKVRPLTHDEGAIDSSLVTINRDDYLTVIRRKALAKLTLEEREALNIPPSFE